MSDFGDAFQGVWNLLDMLGSVVRKSIRGKRTTLSREWRSRDNGWLGLATLMIVVVFGFLLWGFLVM